MMIKLTVHNELFEIKKQKITGSQHYNATDMHMMKMQIHRSHTFRKVQPLDMNAVNSIYTQPLAVCNTC